MNDGLAEADNDDCLAELAELEELELMVRTKQPVVCAAALALARVLRTCARCLSPSPGEACARELQGTAGAPPPTVTLAPPRVACSQELDAQMPAVPTAIPAGLEPAAAVAAAEEEPVAERRVAMLA